MELSNQPGPHHKHLSAAKTPQEQTMLQWQIDATDRQIDRFVYELFGLPVGTSSCFAADGHSPPTI